MISQEKWMILTPLQKLPNYVGDLGKIIFSTSFELLPKVHKIAQSGHTGANPVVQLISWAVKAYLTAWPQNWIFVAFSSEKKPFWTLDLCDRSRVRNMSTGVCGWSFCVQCLCSQQRK